MPVTPYSPLKTVPPTAGTSWAGLATSVFSFPVMCMFLLAGAIFRYSPRGIAESDIWWHLRNAQNLVQYHSLSRIDTYTFTAAGSPWVSFEWLSEVPFFLAFRATGLRGILLVYSTLMVLIFAGVYYRCCRAGADCKDATVATLGAMSLAGVSMAPRTLLFGWLCMVALMLVLDYFRRTEKGVWLLPPLLSPSNTIKDLLLMAITVLLADDHEVMRKTIARLLASDPEIELVAEAASFAQTMDLLTSLHPKIVVLDLHMGDERAVVIAGEVLLEWFARAGNVYLE